MKGLRKQTNLLYVCYSPTRECGEAGGGLSVVQHRTGDEIAAQTQSEAPALWVIALENHCMSGQIAQ